LLGPTWCCGLLASHRPGDRRRRSAERGHGLQQPADRPGALAARARLRAAQATTTGTSACCSRAAMMRCRMAAGGPARRSALVTAKCSSAVMIGAVFLADVQRGITRRGARRRGGLSGRGPGTGVPSGRGHPFGTDRAPARPRRGPPAWQARVLGAGRSGDRGIRHRRGSTHHARLVAGVDVYRHHRASHPGREGGRHHERHRRLGQPTTSGPRLCSSPRR
jgi:hypothetical protein